MGIAQEVPWRSCIPPKKNNQESEPQFAASSQQGWSQLLPMSLQGSGKCRRSLRSRHGCQGVPQGQPHKKYQVPPPASISPLSRSEWFDTTIT